MGNIINPSRRGFIAGLASLVVAAPAVVRASSLMPLRGVIVPHTLRVLYQNRTIRSYLDIETIRDQNVLLQPQDVEGVPIVQFRGIPIRVLDFLDANEVKIVRALPNG